MSKKFILILVVALIVIAGGIFYFLYKKPVACKEMYDEIENNLDNANYCEINSDCDAILLGGRYIKFGCYHYINKSIDKEQIYQKMSVYDKKCDDMINKCAPAPTAQCVSNKCVKVQ